MDLETIYEYSLFSSAKRWKNKEFLNVTKYKNDRRIEITRYNKNIIHGSYRTATLQRLQVYLKKYTHRKTGTVIIVMD